MERVNGWTIMGHGMAAMGLKQAGISDAKAREIRDSYRARNPKGIEHVEFLPPWEKGHELTVIVAPVRYIHVRCSPGTRDSFQRGGRTWIVVPVIVTRGLGIPDAWLRNACVMHGFSFALSWLVSRWSQS